VNRHLVIDLDNVWVNLDPKRDPVERLTLGDVLSDLYVDIQILQPGNGIKKRRSNESRLVVILHLNLV
jgi:hypothetical protein